MKKKTIIILTFTLFIPLVVQAQDNTDYFFFSENRACIPGIELMNSLYTENPAKAAEGVNNSIAYTGIFIPGEETPGQAYTLSIPNFSLVNIGLSNHFKETSIAPEEEAAKKLLGIQYALSLNDFISLDWLETSLGLGFYKSTNTNITNNREEENYILDLGSTLSLFGSRFEFLLSNFLVTGEDNTEFFGDSFDVSVKIRGQIILDIDYILGYSTARGYGVSGGDNQVDFIGELTFIRFFFSSSLRTGVRLETFVDLDNNYTQIPVIKYSLSMNYSPFNSSLDLFDNNSADPWLGSFSDFLAFMTRNLTFNLSTEMVIKNSEAGDSFVPMVALGVIKYF